MRDVNGQSVFTTGEVAKMTKVASRTVSKWFDSGELKGYRIPRSQDRRIPRDNLIEFLKKHGMPMGDLEDDTLTKVIIVSRDSVLVKHLRRVLTPERLFKIAVARCGFDAGIQVDSLHPNCVVMDFSIGCTEALQICRHLHRDSDFESVLIIALLPDNGNSMSSDYQSVVNETFKRPFDIALLAERLFTFACKKEFV